MVIDCRLFCGKQIIDIVPISIVFKHKEHEFARVAIALCHATPYQIDSVELGNFFRGDFYCQLQEDHIDWYIFIAIPDSLWPIQEDILLFCDAYSHEITNNSDNQSVSYPVLKEHIISIKQTIQSRPPKILQISYDDLTEHDCFETHTHQFKLRLSGENMAKILKKLKQLGKYGNIYNISNVGNSLNFAFTYRAKYEIKYDIIKTITNEHPVAFGYETIHKDYDDMQLVDKKLYRLCQYIHSKIETVLQINIKIGNILELDGIKHQIVSIEHYITGLKSYTIIHTISNSEHSKSLYLSGEAFRFLGKQTKYVIDKLSDKTTLDLKITEDDFDCPVVLSDTDFLKSTFQQPTLIKYYIMEENFRYM
jgi:hypothetical protein